IYEFINVSVPYINNCEQAGNGQECDPVMIATLEKLAANNATEEEQQNDDPTWDALKKLK
ncbi:MAG: DUF177 domain-containing protein, partial [Pedobacter sp.]|nr:DUF177 domain-containing protein [Pedobacter sp.]